MQDDFTQQLPDRDPQETREWIESLEAVIEANGNNHARNLLYRLLESAQRQGVAIPEVLNTPYINTIPASAELSYPGDENIERRIRRIIRWNAAMMVSRANKRHGGIGGHISTYASAASLYEIGFHHFFRGKEQGAGDLIYFQGHASPGIYSRAFLEGRLSEAQMDHFRREAFTAGLSSYPHPRLMPDFWEFPTVSMGLGPTNAIYQARFNRYLHARGIADTSRSRVWAFPGDGECDEPETLHALTLASREQLDNLIFVVNCNLQRLDGPVRGNGKIIQELEAKFLGAGWNVIKVIWGSDWDPLLARDRDGLLLARMEETLDGDYQRLAVESADNIREQFFGPELQHLIAGIPDDKLTRMRRGGHDTQKVYAAYKAAVEHEGAPTAILAKTVKGWALGGGFEARNITHQKKALEAPDLKFFRDLLELPIPDDELGDFPYYLPAADSEEVQYLLSHRDALGGCIPHRTRKATKITLPKRVRRRQRQAGSLDDDGVRAADAQPDALGRVRKAYRPHRAGRGAHLRDGGALPRVQDLQRARAGLHPGRRQIIIILRRGGGRPDSRGGHLRGGSDELLYGSRHDLCQLRRTDRPVLHLLLDVRLPARRRRHLVRCRLAR